MPTIGPPMPHRVLAHHYVWDLWPVQEMDGRPTTVHGAELWMTLSAPSVGHPELRHDSARLRLLAKADNEWTDLGHVFTDGSSPGSREWSGSAVRRPDGTISTFYTAAGDRGESKPTYHQRVVEARPQLIVDRDAIRLERQVEHRTIVRSGSHGYLPADEIDGGPGRIKAFRDPGWFRDPADGSEYLLIAASVPYRDRYSGAVALAKASPGGWALCPPLVVADGVNHEIERPHIVVHDSRYYLFFCTHRDSFDPRGAAPTGLYGFVGHSVAGPYAPLNGSGLVVGNPLTHPDQAYAWLVLSDLRVVGFANYLPGIHPDPRQAHADQARTQFAGTIAPVLDLALDGARTTARTA